MVILVPTILFLLFMEVFRGAWVHIFSILCADAYVIDADASEHRKTTTDLGFSYTVLPI